MENLDRAHDEADRENRKRKMERVAEEPSLKLLARVNMAYVSPTLLLIIAALAGLIWNDQREAIRDQAKSQKDQTAAIWAMTVEINSLKNAVNNIITFQIPTIQQFFNSRFDAQATRIDALARAEEQHSKDIKELQLKSVMGK